MLNKTELKEFFELSYTELEKFNLEAKKKFLDKIEYSKVEKHYRDFLENETKIKAVTVGFANIEGHLHTLDYDKKFFLKSTDNLTFDGSSIRGFSTLEKSDLRLKPDWYSLRVLPSDVFGPGKVFMFADVCDVDGSVYTSDMRGQLKKYLENLYKTKKQTVYFAPEIEGFLLKGAQAEQHFDEKTGFELLSSGGYFNDLPSSPLKDFIDTTAEAQRALGFENEKDHPEVAPSQFELNYSYTDALLACDQVLLYKLVARQVAYEKGMTACFLPKPIVGINGSGMHTNLSIFEGKKNLFYDAKGEDSLSVFAQDFISRTLNHASDICLILNASVNAYRRLDPNFEAPNQIKVSATDRSSMIRIPLGNEKSTRIEVRSVSPDANPYLLIYTIVKTGLEGEKLSENEDKRKRTRILPGTITDAIRYYKTSDFVTKILGEEVKNKYLEYKQVVADRSPKELGKTIKNGEVVYHHEVTNQILWNEF